MFKKYNSIENTYREEFLDRIKGHGFWDGEFLVQEKAHGGNLSFWTVDGENFKSGKRTGEIERDELFYNHDQILIEIKPGLKRIWNELANEIGGIKQLTIFGELIGGEYPHPEIDPIKKAIRIQNGIFYSPRNHFYAFDILINSEEYLSPEKANYHFEKQRMLYAKTIFKGSIIECLDYPNAFNSLIPKELGLPELDPNIVEGVVIRPSKNRFFNNGTRVILKNKNEKWAENKKYHKQIKKGDEFDEKIEKLQEAILTYVTENRFYNVISKVGEIGPKDFGKVLGLFNKDVIEDFLKDYHEITSQLDKKELKMVTKSFHKSAIEMLKEQIKST